MYLTKQEIFDKVAKHLLTQKKISMAPTLGCAYRGDNGLKCAIGALIPDEHYDPTIEGLSVRISKSNPTDKEISLLSILEKSGIDTSNDDVMVLCGALQYIHDDGNTHMWHTRLQRLANCKQLDGSVLNQFPE